MEFMNIVDNVVIDDNPMIECQMNSDGTWTCGNIHTSIRNYLLEKMYSERYSKCVVLTNKEYITFDMILKSYLLSHAKYHLDVKDTVVV